MKTKSLSNHPEEQRSLIQEQQVAARRTWKIWRRLAIPALRHDQARFDAGIAGEESVAVALSVLSDEWHLFRGYRNRRGEIDHVVVGPGGIWAIEVKNRRATVYVDADNWRFEKFDNYGNLVEEGVLTDRRGRSWSRQLNEPADELSRFLASRNKYSDISRAVVLTNPRAELGRYDRLTVDVCVGTRLLLSQISSSPERLRSDQVQALAILVQRDHDFHSKRRR